MSLKEKENHISESLSENLVTDYLKNNPNFFVENPLGNNFLYSNIYTICIRENYFFSKKYKSTQNGPTTSL